VQATTEYVPGRGRDLESAGGVGRLDGAARPELRFLLRPNERAANRNTLRIDHAPGQPATRSHHEVDRGARAHVGLVRGAEAVRGGAQRIETRAHALDPEGPRPPSSIDCALRPSWTCPSRDGEATTTACVTGSASRTGPGWSLGRSSVTARGDPGWTLSNARPMRPCRNADVDGPAVLRSREAALGVRSSRRPARRAPSDP
jgi:hypothetical protein